MGPVGREHPGAGGARECVRPALAARPDGHRAWRLLPRDPQGRPRSRASPASVVRISLGSVAGMYDESAGAIAVHPLRDSSFVGRAEEYALLTEVAAAAETGQPQVVLVGGEAGVGKSRLVEYVASILQGRGWRVLVGSCTARGSQALPLAPFIAALRRLIRDLGIEDAARTFPEGFGFELLLPEWSGKRLEPEVLTSTPLFHGFMILFEQLSADAPLLFVLEDVHDADPETLKLVGALARSLDNVPVLIVATYRTDDVFRGHPLRPLLSEWQRIRNIRHLVLDRFSRTETAELIENTSGKRPSDALLTRIFGRSGGNAFFVEQLARTELAGVAGGLPDTLRDLLLNRLEQLPQPVREVVQLIAVGGPVVAHRLLASVADMPEDALLAALRVAVDAHVLITSEDGYGFQHALVREAAVDALLPGERIRMHHAYADALDRQPNLVAAERHAAGTAYHWLGAGRPDRALPLPVRAAAVAEGFRAYAEQHQLLTCALEAWPNALEPGIAWLDLLVAAAQAACRAVAHDHAHRLIDQALDDADPAGDADQVAALLALRSRILLRQGGKGALAAAQEAARLALPERSPARAAVFEVLATALTSDGVPDNALTASADAVRLATDLGDEELQVKALSTAALVFSHLGRHEQGVAAYERARAIAEKIRDMEGLTRVCVNFSLELWAYGRHEEGIAVAAAGVQAARRAGLTNAQGMYAATNLAGSLFATGRWDEAEHVLTEALEEGPCDVYLGYPHMMLAELALGRGDLTGARRHHAVASQLLFSQLERLECGLPMARLTAELALMENRFADARLAITAVLDAATVRGQTAA